MNYKSFLSFLILNFFTLTSFTQTKVVDLRNEEGNHTWAKSEAWTWMGHLNEYYTEPNGIIKMTNDGFALIHYYTRNETQFGELNFKSSAITFTKNEIGILYDKKTTYSEPKNSNKKFELKIKEDDLEIQFQHSKKIDLIKKVEITNNDIHQLKTILLPQFQHLQITSGFNPIKYVFKCHVGSNSFLDLEIYQIWPSVSPINAQMQFLGLEETYTFSQPMLVAIGSIHQKDKTKKVIGLMFLDRQWSQEYFGTHIMSDPVQSLKENQALKYSHSWSAFHAFSEESKNWYFVHLWQQFKRNPNLNDELTNYSGIIWTKNGIQQSSIGSNQFTWTGSNYIKNSSSVILNYAEGREQYFPSQYKLLNLNNNDNIVLSGSPILQSLDQPIYLYEGYASGSGIWNNERVHIKGRLESSRLMFRKQDYIEMITNINQSNFQNNSDQEDLKFHLEKIIEKEEQCELNILCFIEFLKIKKAQFEYAFNELNRKLTIGESGIKPKKIKRDPTDSKKIIYN